MAFGFGDVVHAAHAMPAPRRQGKWGDDVEDFAQRGTTRTRRRRGSEIVAVIAAVQRGRLLDAIVREIVHCENAAVLGGRGDHRARDRTAIERIGSVARDELERPRQLRLAQNDPGARRRAVRREDRSRAGIDRTDVPEDLCVACFEREPVARQPNRRRHQWCARHGAELTARRFEAEHGSGDADREPPFLRARSYRVAVLVEIHPRTRAHGRLFAKVDEALATVVHAQHHESPAADVAAARMGDGQGVADGDRRVDRVSASFENPHPGLGRIDLRRGNHGMGGDRDRLRRLRQCRCGQGKATSKRNEREALHALEFGTFGPSLFIGNCGARSKDRAPHRRFC